MEGLKLPVGGGVSSKERRDRSRCERGDACRGREKSSRWGFTLIELLIVVAIISILAVIAIPNLMQARIRSKVAKAKQELKTITTALEIYNVDQNDYPPNTHIDFGDLTVGLLRFNLTTPVDYLSNKDLRDPFVPPHYAYNPLRQSELFYTYQNIRWYRGLYSAPYQPSDTSGSAWRLPDGVTRPEEFYGAWRTCSYGPDQKYNEYPPYAWGMMDYDPTNGTVSNGNIWLGEKRGFVLYHPGT